MNLFPRTPQNQEPVLGRLGPVKAIGINTALRVAEIQSTREGACPQGQPAHQIGRCFNDHQLPRWAREKEAKLSAGEAKARSGRDDDRMFRYPPPVR